MQLDYPGVMAVLTACPFCRKLYTQDEGRTCPDCDVALVAMDRLPPSREALEEEEAEFGPLSLPENRLLPSLYLGRGRGALIALSLAGLGSFFLPWVELTMPETAVYSGFDLASGRAGWLWGGATAWLVMTPLSLTRRTIAQMRGVRVVAVMLAAMTITEVVMLLLLPPRRGLVPLELGFRYGIYLSGIISLIAVGVAARFGGSLSSLPNFLVDVRVAHGASAGKVAETSAGETLH